MEYYQIENQVCTLEHAKKIGELGVKAKSVFFWGWPDWEENPKFYIKYWEDAPSSRYYIERYNAYSAAELSCLLPAQIITCKSFPPQGLWVTKNMHGFLYGYDNALSFFQSTPLGRKRPF